VTKGRLPQRAGLPGLNGGGAAAAVPPHIWYRNTRMNNTVSRQPGMTCHSTDYERQIHGYTDTSCTVQYSSTMHCIIRQTFQTPHFMCSHI